MALELVSVKDVLEDYLGDECPEVFRMTAKMYWEKFKCHPGTRIENVNLRQTYRIAVHFDMDHFDIVEAFRVRLTPRYKCRVCGCTEEDCSQCIEKTGESCHWIEEDLCSACRTE